MGRITVSFLGHRKIDHALAVEQKLESIVCQILNREDFVDFLVGRNGEFDQIATSAIRRCKRKMDSDCASLNLVLPYLTSEVETSFEDFQEYYDHIEVDEIAAASHFRSAFRIRNRNMINRSDFVIFYVCQTTGGAYQAMEYAKKQGIPYCNLAQEDAAP